MTENMDLSKTSLGKVNITTDKDSVKVAAPVEKSTALGDMVNDISKPHVLWTLMKICEMPGGTKNFYTAGSKSSFYAIDVLKRRELIYDERNAYEKYPRWYPTEYGKSLYTGIWYAAGKDALVPKMQSKHLLVPFIFWPDSTYTISKDLNDHYSFKDTKTGEAISAYDVTITSDGDIWFSIDGMSGRYMLDVEEDIDTLDEVTQNCVREIITKSREIELKRFTENYKDLLDNYCDGTTYNNRKEDE